MQTTYQLTSRKHEGYIELSYLNGYLNSIKIEFKLPLILAQWLHFKDHLAYQEENINSLTKLGFTIQKTMPTNVKLALFCRLYEQFTTVKYKVSPADSGKVKFINITEALLLHYFKSENFLFKNKYSIANLVKYYNELLVEIASHSTSKYPSQWSKEFEQKLKDTDLPAYWAHLRSLGLEAVQDRMGRISGWIPKTANKI